MDEESDYCGCGSQIECVGCGEDREYGSDRRWRGMKLFRERQCRVQYETEIFGRQARHYGFGGKEREKNWVDYFIGFAEGDR